MRCYPVVRAEVLRFVCIGALVASGCSAHTQGSDVAPDAGDPRCATQAVALGTHPHAVAQPTAHGRTLADTRGWHGRVYFAYGDLEVNTGPIVISSYEPSRDRR